jgi:hypothetical protein
MSEDLITELKHLGRTMLDAATELTKQEFDLEMAHKLLGQGADLAAGTEMDDWSKRVNDYLMRA